jgi:hypothetical protein
MDHSNPISAEIAWMAQQHDNDKTTKTINELTETVNDLLTIIQNNDSFKNIDIKQELDNLKNQRIQEERKRKLSAQLTPEEERELQMQILKYG